MDQNPVDAILKSNTPNTVDPPSQKNGHLRNRRGAMHILKVALFVIRRRSVKKKTLAVEEGSRSVWRRLVGSMRPLHLQSNHSPPPTLESKLPAVALPPISENTNDIHCEEALFSTFESPVEGEGYESQQSPSHEPESRYASALALNELVDQSEENHQQQIAQECQGYVDDDGDVMIDAKAEEFIAQFYEEMRLQRLHYVEMDHSHQMILTS